MVTQSLTCQLFLVASKQLQLSIHTRCSPTTVRMHTSWSLGTQPQALPSAPLADCSRKQQMRLPGAPQLSVHVNQMIAKAKHHWCNSRIDKCCSLRLIQRRVAGELGLVAARLLVSLWVCACPVRAAIGHAVWWRVGRMGAVGTHRPRKNC